MASEQQFDLTIIGGGPGGYVAAIYAAQLGGRVALVEKARLGGTCLNVGCIPTKALIESAEALRIARAGEEFGFRAAEVVPDMSAMLARKRRIVDQLVNGVGLLMRANRVEVVAGQGRVRGPGQVEVQTEGGDQRSLSSRSIVLATGSAAGRIPVPGSTLPRVLTSDDIIELKEIPASLVIIGAGFIGVEFAGIYSALGTRVTMLEMLPMVLPAADDEIARRFLGLLKRDGVEVTLQARVREIREAGEEMEVVYETAEGEARASGNYVLMATGRLPYTEGLGLAEAGIAMNGRFIAANERMETNVPGVYAIGDVVGKYMLAHSASMEGEVAVANALGQPARMNYRAVPGCVYSYPEIASVGLTEQQAKDQGIAYKVSRFPLTANARAVTLGDPRGMVKELAEEDTGAVVGVHIMGPRATEMIAEATLAIQMEATVDDIAATIHAHPTLAEAFREATLGFLHGPIHIARRT